MDHVINVRKIKSFKKTDVKKALELVNVKTKPHFYGNAFYNHNGKELPIEIVRGPDGSLFWDIDLKDIDMTDIFSQWMRSGGENPKKDEIREDITFSGYSLQFDPPKIRMLKDGTLVPGAGVTRLSILKELGVKNVICVVYTGKAGFSEEEVDLAFFSFFGGENRYHKPSGKLLKEDVVFLIKNLIVQEKISLDRDIISWHVNELSHGLGWQNKTKEELTNQIFNSCVHRIDSNGKRIVVKSYTSKPSIKSFMVNYPDTDDIKYAVYATGSLKKIPYAIGEMLLEFPKVKEIRIVLHTDLLKGYDPEESYIDRLIETTRDWNKEISKLDILYGKKMSTKVKFGRFIPAVSSLTPNMDELVILGVNDGFLKNPPSTKTKKSLNKTLGISSFVDTSENEKEEVAA